MAVASAGPYASLHVAPDRQPRQHPTTRFLQAGCPSCRPTNGVKALKTIFNTIILSLCLSTLTTLSAHFSATNMRKITSSINRKYIVYRNAAERGPQYYRRQHAKNVSRFGRVFPEICLRTDIQIDNHAYHNTPLHYRGGVATIID